MAKNYHIDLSTLGPEWDRFVRSSPDESVFFTSDYLANCGARLGLYACYNAEELRAQIAVIEGEDGSSIIFDELVIYSGFCYGPPTSGQSKAQHNSERHELATFIVKELAARYEKIQFNLPPSVIDVRAFQWYNYGQSMDRFAIDVRYTSYLNIADFSDFLNLESTEAYKQCTGARRQQIRYGRQQGIQTSEFFEIGMFIDFYCRTLQRQGVEVDKSYLARLSSLLEGLENSQRLRMFVSSTKENEPGSIAVFGFDTKRAYYLFGASDPSLRNTPTGTAVLWDAFYELAKNGLKQVDLEGVNSPNRGWFKLSFGGDLVPYFQITK